MRLTIVICLLTGIIACHGVKRKEDLHIIKVHKAVASPTLDGKVTESCWNHSPWHPIDQNWLGNAFTHEDFNGRYKLSWDGEGLYILAEIHDDMLFDKNKDPLKRWWDDDCIEVFVDEDNSGGLHQYSHNAFGYHVALDGHVVDLGTDREPHLYDEHIRSARQSEGKTTIWELAVKVYPQSYTKNNDTREVKLRPGKKLGFALAYCDNDGSLERENFIGSVFILGTDKNQAWVNADILGTLVLVE
jgi:hypothetical protein